MSFDKVFRVYDPSNFTTPFSVEELASVFDDSKGKDEDWNETVALAWGYFRDANNREINTLSTSEALVQYVVLTYAETAIEDKNRLVVSGRNYRVIRTPQEVDNRGKIQVVPLVEFGREN